MKQERNISREVDAYLDGVMSREDEAAFLKELQKDLDIQREVELQKKINQSLRNERESLELESQLNAIYDDVYRPMNKVLRLKIVSKQNLIRISGVAAALLLLLFAGLTIFNHSDSSVELFAEYYQPAEMNMSFRAAEDVVDSDLRKAMSFYEQKNYGDAIILFEQILKSDNSRIGLNLYSGISNMEINDYEKANKNFQQIIDHKANAFIESAEWYLGLCYLMTSEKEKAAGMFIKIVSEEGFYRKDAKKILNKMD